MPPEKFENPSEIESEGIFNGLLPGLLQSSALQNNYCTAIWLVDYIVDYIISLRNCITSLRDYNTTIRSI